MSIRFQVTFDCLDPARVATFWAEALGYKTQDPPEGFESWHVFLKSVGVPESNWNDANAVVDPDGIGPRIYFQRVEEPKTLKNRVHLDLNVSAKAAALDQDRKAVIFAEVDRLISLGASKVETIEEHGDFWVVMRDPEDNEFCLQ